VSDPFDLLVLGDANPDLVLTGDVEPAFGQAERLVAGARLTVGGSGAIVAAGASRLGLAGGGGHAGIVTRGADGVTVAAPDGTSDEGALYERGRYPVGSGDAFLGGLVVGLELGDRWPDALRLALGAAAANAELPGAGALDAARADALAARADIREL